MCRRDTEFMMPSAKKSLTAEMSSLMSMRRKQGSTSQRPLILYVSNIDESELVVQEESTTEDHSSLVRDDQ